VNRVGDLHFPNSSTLAGVVFKPGAFDAVRNPLFQKAYYGFGLSLNFLDAREFLNTQKVALDILSGRIPDRTGGATYFFTGPPTTAWQRTFPITLRIPDGGFTFERQP